MEIFHWIIGHGFDVLGALGIIGSLLFTAFSLRSETHTRRLANLLIITENHRELWSQVLERPQLSRVLKKSSDILSQPVTRAEQIFVLMVIQHVNTVHYALSDKLLINLEGVRRDVAWFFSLPIPRAVWEQTKAMQNDDFVAFVDDCLTGK